MSMYCKSLAFVSRKTFRQKLPLMKIGLPFSQAVTNDTIFALSSGFGKCGVAVVRVTGPRVPTISLNIAGFKHVPEPRKVFLRTFKDPESRGDLDRGIFVYFKQPHSFTGEDCCELQVHGGSAVVAAVLNALSRVPGCRPAEPGEFTRRAFYAGKLDLTEVEGLADLINAETEAQRKQALLQMGGSLNDQYTSWRASLLLNLAHLEAFIDFSEEENIEDNVLNDVITSLKNLKCSVERHLSDGGKGERVRSGVRTVIIGAPNVGKSSLLNVLTNDQTAIVSSSPGTTRDVVKTVLDIKGYPVTLCDTAGLRVGSSDTIEIEGMSRARTLAHSADLILVVVNSVDFANWFESSNDINQNNFVTIYLDAYLNSLGLSDIIDYKELLFNSRVTNVSKRCLIVFNKADLLNSNNAIRDVCERHRNFISISCKTEYGFSNLIDCLEENLKHLCGSSSRENPLLSRERHRYHLMACCNSISRFLEISKEELDSQIDIGAEHIRNSATELGKITGNISAEDVLDVVFKQFCIGK
ncbi:tRNA modification GTPase GTPBP3, mitochondrial isoform X1 [Nilaparvata lugens]|uniref:tRNA modification GTPase GTPBP3, mitochondrial isoform X1 n=1 Tax=Nilaparvata lugens TaxID=108931 RepID=UPI000B980FE6|nr:tRNA modification GTPase GTPBP3, mitochondrial isoform X1 [Nilaparvata lugens]XP_039294830.1 tRNA modification GTPase GTPBP3, mitochondrial isoform X1 [Nilaparvata lugens]XP_039294835.1 tRNA modification GTPase GTPBP3, mitochondrial isoform X1 [Nilaparvata lugens]XP_039294840.1 tRNA modification GTPase GTPBP3, mitochondrial isoform X1 [Nilaparvata lugens]XP_039294848.1 tRNA modification GTPase GTPBP3, mitochondrial isoform X1 [Nilaparvata lugens]